MGHPANLRLPALRAMQGAPRVAAAPRGPRGRGRRAYRVPPRALLARRRSKGLHWPQARAPSIRGSHSESNCRVTNRLVAMAHHHVATGLEISTRTPPRFWRRLGGAPRARTHHYGRRLATCDFCAGCVADVCARFRAPRSVCAIGIHSAWRLCHSLAYVARCDYSMAGWMGVARVENRIDLLHLYRLQIGPHSTRPPLSLMY